MTDLGRMHNMHDRDDLLAEQVCVCVVCVCVCVHVCPFLLLKLLWDTFSGVLYNYICSRVHNTEREGEDPTLYCVLKTHCVKLLHHLSDILV